MPTHSITRDRNTTLNKKHKLKSCCRISMDFCQWGTRTNPRSPAFPSMVAFKNKSLGQLALAIDKLQFEQALFFSWNTHRHHNLNIYLHTSISYISISLLVDITTPVCQHRPDQSIFVRIGQDGNTVSVQILEDGIASQLLSFQQLRRGHGVCQDGGDSLWW